MKADIIVKGIIWNRDLNRILIAQRCKEDEVGANTWENVGGNLEEGENPEQALRREIREEVGITDIHIERVAYVALVPVAEPYLIIVYLCETKEREVFISPEHQAYLWADEQDCRGKLPEAIIEDFEKHNIFSLCPKEGGVE